MTVKKYYSGEGIKGNHNSETSIDKARKMGAKDKQKRKRKTPISKPLAHEGDLSNESKELNLYIQNDGDLYRQRTQPIISNLAKKMNRGEYDHDKAAKLWQYLADDGAKKYQREFGSPEGQIFSVHNRKETARSLADDYLENIQDKADQIRKESFGHGEKLTDDQAKERVRLIESGDYDPEKMGDHLPII